MPLTGRRCVFSRHAAFIGAVGDPSALDLHEYSPRTRDPGHAGHLVTAAEVLADAGMRAVESPEPRPVPSASSATAGRNLQPR